MTNDAERRPRPGGGGEPAGAWPVEWLTGSAGELHADLPPPRRSVRVAQVVAPAVVLGSTQPEGTVGRLPDGVELARRRSGGGAVWLAPQEQVWVDIVIPRDDPLWDTDVVRAAGWVGEAWAKVLAAGHGAAGIEVHRGPLTHRRASRVACFAGTGPGEVSRDGRKVVGVSQRRTRDLARFQCVTYLRWDPEPLLSALAGTTESEILAEVGRRLRSGVAAFDPTPVDPAAGVAAGGAAGDVAGGAVGDVAGGSVGDVAGGAVGDVVGRLVAVLP